MRKKRRLETRNTIKTARKLFNRKKKRIAQDSCIPKCPAVSISGEALLLTHFLTLQTAKHFRSNPTWAKRRIFPMHYHKAASSNQVVQSPHSFKRILLMPPPHSPSSSTDEKSIKRWCRTWKAILNSDRRRTKSTELWFNTTSRQLAAIFWKDLRVLTVPRARMFCQILLRNDWLSEEKVDSGLLWDRFRRTSKLVNLKYRHVHQSSILRFPSIS